MQDPLLNVAFSFPVRKVERKTTYSNTGIKDQQSAAPELADRRLRPLLRLRLARRVAPDDVMLGEPDVTPALLNAVEHAVIIIVVAGVAGNALLLGAQSADTGLANIARRARLAEEVLDGLNVVAERGVAVDGRHDASADVMADGHVPAGGAAIPRVAGRLA
jgi:radical SAM superfamily enzyme with C-terminal helix-hairpin-helix motif